MIGRRLRRAAYRCGQFFRAATATFGQLTAAELAQAHDRLPAAAWPLFDAMPVADQRHSLAVMAALQAAGHAERPLMEAALLHDCAKRAGDVRLWQRVAKVLLRTFWPALWARWTADPAPDRGAWRYGLWAYRHHPALSAGLAAAAGCDPQAVALIRRHEEPLGPDAAAADPLLRALQAADDDY